MSEAKLEIVITDKGVEAAGAPASAPPESAAPPPAAAQPAPPASPMPASAGPSFQPKPPAATQPPAPAPATRVTPAPVATPLAMPKGPPGWGEGDSGKVQYTEQGARWMAEAEANRPPPVGATVSSRQDGAYRIDTTESGKELRVRDHTHPDEVAAYERVRAADDARIAAGRDEVISPGISPKERKALDRQEAREDRQAEQQDPELQAARQLQRAALKEQIEEAKRAQSADYDAQQAELQERRELAASIRGITEARRRERVAVEAMSDDERVEHLAMLASTRDFQKREVHEQRYADEPAYREKQDAKDDAAAERAARVLEREEAAAQRKADQAERRWHADEDWLTKDEGRQARAAEREELAAQRAADQAERRWLADEDWLTRDEARQERQAEREEKAAQRAADQAERKWHADEDWLTRDLARQDKAAQREEAAAARKAQQADKAAQRQEQAAARQLQRDQAEHDRGRYDPFGPIAGIVQGYAEKAARIVDPLLGKGTVSGLVDKFTGRQRPAAEEQEAKRRQEPAAQRPEAPEAAQPESPEIPAAEQSGAAQPADFDPGAWGHHAFNEPGKPDNLMAEFEPPAGPALDPGAEFAKRAPQPAAKAAAFDPEAEFAGAAAKPVAPAAEAGATAAPAAEAAGAVAPAAAEAGGAVAAGGAEAGGAAAAGGLAAAGAVAAPLAAIAAVGLAAAALGSVLGGVTERVGAFGVAVASMDPHPAAAVLDTAGAALNSWWTTAALAVTMPAAALVQVVVGPVLQAGTTAVKDLGAAVEGTARKLSEYSGALAAQQAQQEITTILRDMERANRFESSVGGANQGWFELNQSIGRIEDKFLPFVYKAGELIFKYLDGIAKGVDEDLTLILKALDVIVEWMNRALPIMSPAAWAAGFGTTLTAIHNLIKEAVDGPAVTGNPLESFLTNGFIMPPPLASTATMPGAPGAGIVVPPMAAP